MNTTIIRQNPIYFLVLVNISTTLLTFFASALVGAPFSIWFKDTPYVLLGAVSILLLLGVIWDGAIIAFGILSEAYARRNKNAIPALYMVAALRNKRFFTCCGKPLILVLLTIFAIIGTSNITLINLQLLGDVTQWHDAQMWVIEGGLIEWITSLNIPVNYLDLLYHSCWINELFAIFFLIVLGRNTQAIQQYCVSLILLFYIGRFLGILNPVMGPAFFHPELFTYLDGSITQKAMQYVSAVMASPSSKALDQGGVLLGGVSALPSLHVGMVFITAFWLMIAKRNTLFITIPWLLLVWIATVALGWHYVIDGLGGIALGSLCIFITRYLCDGNVVWAKDVTA
jgi:hypothetical protein